MKRPSVYLISLPLPALICLCVQKLQDEPACCYPVRQLSNLAIKAITFFLESFTENTEQYRTDVEPKRKYLSEHTS